MYVARLAVLTRVAAFVLISLSPLIGWVAFGPVEPYGRPYRQLPNLAALIEGQPGTFATLGDAALERSVVTRMAISLKNTVNYKLRQVDTDTVISGHGKWLFYKGDFWDGKCLDAATLSRLLAQVDAFADMGKVAGLEVIVAVSPDKSWIYPENLPSYFRRYWSCKTKSSALWRRLAKTQVPSLVDHGVPLLTAKNKGDTARLFFYTDSHWTPYGAALGFRQLLKVAFPSAPVDAAPLHVRGIDYRNTDMGNRMLLLRGLEPYRQIYDGVANAVRDEARTVVVLDSFYALLLDQISHVFRNSVVIPNNREDLFAKSLVSADRLIIATVERSFFIHLSSIAFRPTGSLVQSILARNTEAAKGCTNFAKAFPTGIVSNEATSPPSASSSIAPEKHTSEIIHVADTPPGASSCLRLNLKDWRSGPVEVFLPRKMKGGMFEPGRSAVYQPTASGAVALVLPDNVQGRYIKIEVDGNAGISSIELGERTRLVRPAPIGP